MLELAEEDGSVPAALLKQPEILPHLLFAWRAFSALSSDRPLGALGGCGPIPWSCIERYADRHGIVGSDALDRFEALIRAQDRVYLDDAAARMKVGGES